LFGSCVFLLVTKWKCGHYFPCFLFVFLLFAVMKSRGHCVEWREWRRSLLAFVGEMLIRLTTLASGYQPKGLLFYIQRPVFFFYFSADCAKDHFVLYRFLLSVFFLVARSCCTRYRRVIFIYLNVLSFPVREREGE
jgi:hypothetical protein